MSLLVSTVASTMVSAEDDPFEGIEEMVVIGDSTAGLLTSQSTSAIGFDALELGELGVEDLSDVSASIPNLSISSSNSTNASFFVRGVGLQDFGANATGAVSIYQDGVPRNASATQLVGLFDLSGLSVLRGPQGVGSFRNASAGAIQIQTATPEPEFSAFALSTVGRLTTPDARDAARYRFEGAVNAPIYSDTVSARLSAIFGHESPFFENGCANRSSLASRPVAASRNDPAAQLCDQTVRSGQGDGETLQVGERSGVSPFLGRYLGEVDDWGVRAQVRVQSPDRTLDLIVRGEVTHRNRDSTVGQHLGTGGPSGNLLGVRDNEGYRDSDITRLQDSLADQGVPFAEAQAIIQRGLRKDPLDGGPYRGDFDSPGRTILETLALSLTGKASFEAFEMKTNFGFLDYRKSERRDTDLSPNRRFPSAGNDQAWQVAGDVVFSGEEWLDLPVVWEAGVYTLTEQVEAALAQDLLGSAARDNQFTQEIYSLGAWASVEYEFLEGLTVAAGARYNWEQKDFEVQDINTRLLGNGGTFTLPPQRSSNQRTWDALTGFVELRHEFTADVSSYLRYSRGFKAGHFNPSRPLGAKVPGEGYADPESIDAFEWGVSSSFWNGRVALDGAFFFYLYRNYQVFRLSATETGVFRVIQNAERARNYGAEMELDLRPLEGIAPPLLENLRIQFRGGWLETEFLEFTEVDFRLFGAFPTTVLIDYTGNPLISAPSLQVSGTVTWRFEIPGIGTITPRYDFSWTDDVPFDANRGRGQIDGLGRSKFSPYLIGNLAYMIHNVRLSYATPDEGLEVAGWCRNVTDERFTTFAADISNFARQQLHYVGDPRSCGAEVRLAW
ncbi:MAG: TonB-dependent receptor [bacterium]|nr:TonB-dependent receptor [bacterium]